MATMNYLKKILFLIGFQFAFFAIYGQNDSLIQFSGTILTAGRDSLMPVPFVLVKNLTRNSGAYSNVEGNYSLVVARGDVLEYSSVGFRKNRITIPNDIKGRKFYATQIIIRDTMSLPEAIIVPWKDVDDLKKAFVDLKLNEGDIVRAYQNLQYTRWKELQQSVSYDGQAMQQIGLANQNRENIYKQGVQPIQNIFSPLRWAEFIESLKKGKSEKE
jgi:hypothetical protein